MTTEPFDRDLVDPKVTNRELEELLTRDVLEFPELDDGDSQDDPSPANMSNVHALTAVVPNTPKEALANAKRLTDDGTFVGVGMCLATVRGPIFGVPALWPDAVTAMRHSAPFHALTDIRKAPRGSVGFARTRGVHGHTWLNLGGGIVRTTDMHRSGRVDLALGSRMLEWCGAIEFGWGETLNGFDVYPSRPKKPALEPWTLEDKARFLRDEIRQAAETGHPKRAAHLTAWRKRILERIDGK